MGQPVVSPVAIAPGSFRLVVFRIAEGSSWHVRTLSDAYGGLLTHWKAGRSMMCEGKDCRLCRADGNTIWKGYFAAEIWDGKNRWWSPTIVELTEACELDLRHRFQRGQVWLFRREKSATKKKTPIMASLVKESVQEELPAAFDLHAVLRTVYHVPSIDLTHKNPMPDRVMVSPSRGAGPLDLG